MVLTDDEVLGLAGLTGRGWRAVTPTVDVADPADLTVATARGIRSLAARGLARTDGTDRVGLDPALEQVCTAVLDGDLVISLFACEPDLSFDPTGETIVVFAGRSGGCVVDVVAMEGVHTLIVTDTDTARGVVDAALVAGQDPSAEGTDAQCVVVGGRDPGINRVYRLSRGEVSAGALAQVRSAPDPAATLQPVSRLTFDTALSQVFAAL